MSLLTTAGSICNAEDNWTSKGRFVVWEEASQSSGTSKSEGTLGLPHWRNDMACSWLCPRKKMEESCSKEGWFQISFSECVVSNFLTATFLGCCIIIFLKSVMITQIRMELHPRVSSTVAYFGMGKASPYIVCNSIRFTFFWAILQWQLSWQ